MSIIIQYFRQKKNTKRYEKRSTKNKNIIKGCCSFCYHLCTSNLDTYTLEGMHKLSRHVTSNLSSEYKCIYFEWFVHFEYA